MLALVLANLSLAQTNPLSVDPPPKLSIRRGEAIEFRLPVKMAAGYHVNSNTPAEEYLIPLRLSWDAPPLKVESVRFPKPVLEKYAFAEKPLSVFTSDFTIETKFLAPASAAPGLAMAVGKLRYQACTDKLCLPPKTIEIRLPVEIR
jgi:thiol:disulfide interchange protein DsbD